MKVLLTILLIVIFSLQILGQSSIQTFKEYNELCNELNLVSSDTNKTYWELGLKIENVKHIKRRNRKLILKSLQEPYSPSLIFNYLVSKSIFQIEVVSESLENIDGKVTNLTYKCRVVYQNTTGIPELIDQKYIFLCIDKGYNIQGYRFANAHTSTLSIGKKYFVNVKKKGDRYFISNSVQIVNRRINIENNSLKIKQLEHIIKDLSTLI